MADIDIYQGDDKTFRLSVVDSAGSAVDISTWSALTFVAKENRTIATSIISKSLGAGITLVGGGTGGLADIEVEDTDTAGEIPRTLVFAVRGVESGGEIRTLKVGTFEIKENVTD